MFTGYRKLQMSPSLVSGKYIRPIEQQQFVHLLNFFIMRSDYYVGKVEIMRTLINAICDVKVLRSDVNVHVMYPDTDQVSTPSVIEVSTCR